MHLKGANYRKKRGRNNVSSKKVKSLLQANAELKEKLQAALKRIEELEQHLAECSCALQIAAIGWNLIFLSSLNWDTKIQNLRTKIKHQVYSIDRRVSLFLFSCNNHLIFFCKQAQRSSSSWKFQYDLGLVLQVLPIVTPLVFGISLPLVLPQQMHVADHPAFSLPNGLANYSCTYCFHRKQNVKSYTTKVNSKYIAFNMVYVPKRGCRFVVNSCY